MSENTDIVVSNARRHKLNQETITSTPKNVIVLEGGRKKGEMEKNTYIISSVNKIRDEVEASETSIKEKKVIPLEGCE